MHKEISISVTTKGEAMFHLLMLLYPASFRKRYGQQMMVVFQDVYQEELERRGKVGIRFWLSQGADITKSSIEQHVYTAQKLGMKKYIQQTLHINTFNIIGGILLLPITLMTSVEIIARIAQGDLTHYNRPVYNFFAHTFLYKFPILFIWFLLFPLLAVVINIIPLLINIQKKHFPIGTFAFFQKNFISLAFISVGILFLLIFMFHDFAPCMVHGLLNVGFGQFGHILALCRNA